MTHPVDMVYNATRAAWEQYRDMSTPWPEAIEDRCRLTTCRTAVNLTRIKMLEGFPLDARIKQELRVLKAHVQADADYCASPK